MDISKPIENPDTYKHKISVQYFLATISYIDFIGIIGVQ